MPKTTRSLPEKKNDTHVASEQAISEVVHLIKLMGETGLAELRMESPGLKVSLKKESTPAFIGFPPAQPTFSPPPANLPLATPLTAKPPVGESIKTATKPEELTHHQICSPMAGTFYRQPSPNSPPYVKEGDQVKVGQPLCIVEAMKLMNEIKSDVAGRIVKVVMENAKPVEKGSVMFLIDKTA